MVKKVRGLATLLAAALTLALVAGLPPAASAAPTASGQLTGRLVVRSVDDRANRKTTITHSVVVDGRSIGLDAKRAASLAGARTGDTVQLDVAAPAGSSGTRSGLVAAAASGTARVTAARTLSSVVSSGPTGTHKIVIVRLYSGATPPASPTPADFNALISSANSYWRAATANNISLVNANVTNWVKVPAPTTCSDAELNSLFDAIYSAGAAAGATSADYNIVGWMPRGNPDPCGFEGIGEIAGQALLINGTSDPIVLEHELGHNFGLGHSGGLWCYTDATKATAASYTDVCTEGEYEDYYDIMGWGEGHLSPTHLEDLGLLPASGKVDVPYGTSTYTLAPVSTLNGLRVLRFSDGTHDLTVEYRTSTGLDNKIGIGPSAQPGDGVVVRQLIDTSPSSPLGEYTIDAAPVQRAYPGPTPGLRPGETMTVPGSGNTITVLSMDAAGAVVRVNSNPPVAGSYHPLAPSRVLDTRYGVGGTTGPVGPGATVNLRIAGVGAVPASGVGAAVLNVTVTQPTSSGFVTVYPSDSAKPTASNLNYGPNQTVPNLVTVKVGADGGVKFTNSSAGSVQLIADLAGYYTAGAPTAAGAFGAVAPVRVLDTRGDGGPIPGGGVRSLAILGRGGVPASNVSAVVMNVTVTEAKSFGFLTVYPSQTTPGVSNLNFDANQTVPNLATVKVGANGSIDFRNAGSGSVQVIADVAGYFLGGTPTAPGTFVALTPTRLLDTRSNTGDYGPVPPGSTAYLRLDGTGGVVHGATAVTANVTVTQPTAAGYITVYPVGAPQPTASNVNYGPAQTIPNLVTVKLGGAGYIAFANASGGSVQLIADVAGYYR